MRPAFQQTAVRPRRIFLRTAFTAVFLLPGLPAQDAPEPTPQFRSDVHFVLLDVSVTDSKGVPYAGLTQENFRIRDEKQDQPITAFETGATNLSLAVVIDFSGSMRHRRGAITSSVNVLLNGLRDEDEASLWTFNERPTRLQPLSSVSMGLAQPWRASLSEQPITGQTALYDAILRASEDLENSIHERRVLIVLSDGADTASTAKLGPTVRSLQDSGILVYCVGLFQPGEPETNAGALRDVAEATGGLALFDDEAKNLRETLEQILRDLRARYVLEFRSAEPLPGQVQVRKLSVEARDANGKRLRVRTRQQYRVDAQ